MKGKVKNMFKRKKFNGKVIGATHMEGLPVSENTDIIVRLNDELLNLIVVPTKQEFEINISKITSIESKTEVEIQQIISQSAPGMIIGAAAFGLLGAMVGGRVKSKEKKILDHFIIIDYFSDEDKTIILKTNDGLGAKQLKTYFQSLKPQQSTSKVQL